MKAVIIGGAATGAGILVLAGLTSPASATLNIGDGATKVVLAACSTDKPQTKDKVDNCSYIYLTSISALTANSVFTYPTSSGTVSWQNGTVTAGALSYPAAGQTWPEVQGLILGATATVNPKDITGAVETATNKVTLNVPFEITLTASVGGCKLSGTATLTSDATDPKGGGVGKAYDPANGSFAVAAATPPVLTKADGSGAGCAAADIIYDIGPAGTMGWYLNGTMELPGGAPVPDPTPTPTPTPDKAQTASVKLPKKIAADGKTVILKQAVTTNAGQKATSKVTWSTKKSAKGTNKKFASVKTTKAGKVTITTTGKAKKLFVKLALKAPAKTGYTAYSFDKTWKVTK